MEYPSYFKIPTDGGTTLMRIDGPSDETWVHINGEEKSMMDGKVITKSTHSIEKRVVSSVPFFPKGFTEKSEYQSSKEEFRAVMKEFHDFLAEEA